MRNYRIAFVGLSLSLAAASMLVAQDKGKGGAPKGKQQPMSFFITSVGKGKGANYGGLAGADQHCQMLAEAAGSTNFTWRAYLSQQAMNGQAQVNARDRIGTGPWYSANNVMIAQDVATLHGDTAEQARQGNGLNKRSGMNEKGQPVNGVGDQPNMHDILTGSTTDGRAFSDGMDHTCGNWTSEATDGTAQLGHFDRNGGGISWNASHPSRGCSQQNLVATGGAGLLYCFAAGPK